MSLLRSGFFDSECCKPRNYVFFDIYIYKMHKFFLTLYFIGCFERRCLTESPDANPKRTDGGKS